MTPFVSKNILVVDDSVDMRELLTFLLESKGYSVECRKNGEEALELLNSDQDLPELILLDLQMPIMDGEGFLEIQKKSSRLKNIPVIMMTAEDDLTTLKSRFDLKEVLAKPFSMSSVLNAVRQSSVFH